MTHYRNKRARMWMRLLLCLAVSLCMLLVATPQAQQPSESASPPVTPVPPAPDSGAPAAPPSPDNASPPVPGTPVPPPFAGGIPAADAPGAPPPDAGAPDASAATPAQTPSTPNPERVTAVFTETPIERVVGPLSQRSGKTIVARGKTSGQRVTVIAREEPIERVLDRIVNSKPNWLWYKPDDQPNTYEIWDQESFRAEVLPKQVRQKVFVPREITAEEAFKAIQGVLTPNIGAASFDPRSNKVIVTDLPYVLELIQRLIDQIDVKFITRVFYIQHADINTIAEKLSNMKSPAAPAPEVDERTHQIIVRDRLDIIRQMDLIVQTLDIGPEMRVYDLNNLEFEGAGQQDIEDAIQQILTPNAYYKINVQAGKLIVQDVPEVQEKIEKILQAFDQPAKQVWIEAEIVETEFREGFDYSINWTLSKDLFSSVIDGLTGHSADGKTAGSVPVGSLYSGLFTDYTSGDPVKSAAALDQLKNTLGFVNFQNEFPFATVGGEGIDASYLSKNAFIKLKAAMTDSRTRILQQPRELVKNQKEAVFSVGQKVAYFTGGVTIANNSQTLAPNQPQLQFIQVGLDITIDPTINNNGLVEMNVEVRNNSAKIVSRTFGGQPYDAPDVYNQELQSTMIIPSGETRVIGGLITEGKSESRAGVPYLVRIPVIGPALFGSYKKPESDNGRRNLLIFLTPTIVVEKPRDILKYSGKIIMDGADAADDLTTPSPTLSDTILQPMPIESQLPGYQPPPRKSKSATQTAPSKLTMPPPAPEISPETETAPPPQETTNQQTSQENAGELQRIRIEEKEVTTGPMSMQRMPAPRGALTGSASGTPGAPSTGPRPPGGGPPTLGTVATPGVFTTPQSVNVSPPSPPSTTTETKF
ncbi:MAG: secretin N-terminal domain-containing protein [bacterium]